MAICVLMQLDCGLLLQYHLLASSMRHAQARGDADIGNFLDEVAEFDCFSSNSLQNYTLLVWTPSLANNGTDLQRSLA